MAIRHKRKSVSGYVWQLADLVEGQIGINLVDGSLHIKKSDNSIVTIGIGASEPFDSTFVDADLLAGEITFTHELGRYPANIIVYNPSGVVTTCGKSATTTQLTLDFNGAIPAGTWTVLAI